MSFQGRDLLALSYVAPSAVAQFRCVDFTGAQITTAGAKIGGVAKRPAAIGELFEAAVIGTTPIESGGAFSAGQALTTDASGRVVIAGPLSVAAGGTAVTSSAASGAILTGGDVPQFIVGHALQASTAAGQFPEVLLAR